MNGSLPEAVASENLIELLRTLADPIRLRLVRLLETQPGNGAAAGAFGGGVGGCFEVAAVDGVAAFEDAVGFASGGGTERRDQHAVPDGGAGEREWGRSSSCGSWARGHHDPLAGADAARLAAVLRKREPASESFFGKHAPRWDQLRAQWFGDTFHLEGLLALLNPAWTVADIGAGTGAMLPLLAPHVQKIIAVDPSPAMLKGAKRADQGSAVGECGFAAGVAGGVAD